MTRNFGDIRLPGEESLEKGEIIVYQLGAMKSNSKSDKLIFNTKGFRFLT